jgi:integrase
MAWAEKLPSGKYRGVYRDAAGTKRSAGSFSHKPKAERAAAAREELARKSMRRDPEGYRRPWSEWVEDWWQTRNVEPSTLKVDKGRLDRHLTPEWGAVPIGFITRQDVKAWAAKMKRQGTGATTVQRCVHLLSASLSAAVDAGIIDANPAARMKLEGSAKAQERYFTREEFAALRKQMPTTGDQLVLDLMAHTGLRPGEAAGLHWNRVDLERGILRVVETFDEANGGIKAYPKGKRVRDVPLTPELVTALTAERESREAAGEDLRGGCGVEHRTGTCRSALVLHSEGGSVLRFSNWAYRAFKPALLAAEVGHARPYDLRHTFASWKLQAGVPLAEVGKLMGHQSPQTTAIYAHLTEQYSPTAMASFGRAPDLAAPRLPHDKPGLSLVQA